MTDREDYLNKLITYKDYYKRVAYYYGLGELELLVSQWLGTKFKSVEKALKNALKEDDRLNSIYDWVDLVPQVNNRKMDTAFRKAGGIISRGETVCVLKEVARGIVNEKAI